MSLLGTIRSAEGAQAHAFPVGEIVRIAATLDASAPLRKLGLHLHGLLSLDVRVPGNDFRTRSGRGVLETSQEGENGDALFSAYSFDSLEPGSIDGHAVNFTALELFRLVYPQQSPVERRSRTGRRSPGEVVHLRIGTLLGFTRVEIELAT